MSTTTLNTVRNLQYLSKNSAFNIAGLHFLTVDNFDFTRNQSRKNVGVLCVFFKFFD